MEAVPRQDLSDGRYVLPSAACYNVYLHLEVHFATDPFYQPQSSTARMQKLFPQKEEFVYGDTLAIASLNFHRNFFGERCDIRMADGSPAFSGCVAFGLERWFHALLERYGNDTRQILRVLG